MRKPRRGRLLALAILLSVAAALPNQPQEPVIKSGDPSDAKYQRDSERCLRTNAIDNASEIQHDTGPCFYFFVVVSCGGPIHFDGHHILAVRPKKSRQKALGGRQLNRDDPGRQRG